MKTKLNLTFDEIRRIVTDFTRRIKRNDMTLFYFAGHGNQWEDQIYLIPIDDFKENVSERSTTIQSPLNGSDLSKYAINVQNILNEIDDCHPFVNLIFLDCCRTHPLPQSSGYRGKASNHLYEFKPIPVTVGSLIAFACAPGTTADEGKNGNKYGLFTKHLLNHLDTPNEDIERLLRRVRNDVMNESNDQQIPHVTSVLRHDFVCLFERKQESKLNKWKQHGKTVAGGNGQGRQLNQLCCPHGIFIDCNQNLFIADWWNNRIVQWKVEESRGKIVVDGHEQRDGLDQLNQPTDVMMDERNHSLIIADGGNRRVIRWWNDDQVEILIDNISCYGLAMDKDGYLYISDWEKNEVRKWKIGDREGKLVAGGHDKGNRTDQLEDPTYIFVDDEQSIYISDYHNHRVIKWRKDAKEGTVVAGGNGKGKNLNQLNCPTGIIVDKFGRIYVVDCDNYRIIRWCDGKKEGEVIVGGNGRGKESNQMNCSSSLSYDIEGNLYVANSDNHRVQRFNLICN
ncbi:unnamed protein product [Adineta ricciae]|uniref:Peptidase C14 caspase domain-containing protein n=1 Tax=Adineta ricciae TaxID=249248 RepID=A0A813P8U2_ADIRI|nr:unnamed protein product [Adineta ricciae]CAF1515942.1 unnamed protein product [Adineta ricciae]